MKQVVAKASHTRCSSLVTVFGLMLACACYLPATRANDNPDTTAALFDLLPAAEQIAVKKSATGYLKTLFNDPSVEQLTLVDVHPNAVTSATKTLTIPLPGGGSASFLRRSSESLAGGFTQWTGNAPQPVRAAPSIPSDIDVDPFNSLMVVKKGDRLSGNLLIGGQPYRLDYLGQGKHALIKVDESKLPPEGEPVPVPADLAEAVPHGRAVKSSHSTIRVLVVTTNQAREKYPDPELTMASQLVFANQYARDSKVQITFEFAGMFSADYDEAGKDSSRQLYDLRTTGSPLGKAVLARRDESRADLVVMLNVASDFCGRGYINATKALGYSVVSCPSSTAHEMGHNLGADHNWDPGDKEGVPPYQFGYRYNATLAFRTQMSYDCVKGPSCPRIGYFSNPRLTYRGLALGSVEHHDVARRFEERRDDVEAFYPQAPHPKHYAVAHFYRDYSPGSCNYQVWSDTSISDVSCGNITGFGMSLQKTHMQTCLLDGQDQKLVCFYGKYGGSYTIEDIENISSAELPPDLKVEIYKLPIKGQIKKVTYEHLPIEGYPKVSLFSEKNLQGAKCVALLWPNRVMAFQTECYGGAQPKSFKVEGYEGAALCFYKAANAGSVCFTGKYQGDFTINDLDSNTGLPPGMGATRDRPPFSGLTTELLLYR
jgi:hypothetical protein